LGTPRIIPAYGRTFYQTDLMFEIKVSNGETIIDLPPKSIQVLCQDLGDKYWKGGKVNTPELHLNGSHTYYYFILKLK